MESRYQKCEKKIIYAGGGQDASGNLDLKEEKSVSVFIYILSPRKGTRRFI